MKTNIKRSIISILVLVLLVTTLFVASPAQGVKAAAPEAPDKWNPNVQEVTIGIHPQYAGYQIRVRGFNQNDTWTYWNGTVKNLPSGISSTFGAKTSGYKWYGNLMVDIRRNSSSPWKYCGNPRVQGGIIKTANCTL
jgi:hypothetical protein